METKKLWESKQKEKYIFFTNVEDYFKYLEENSQDMDFITKDGFNPEDTAETVLDNAVLRSNINIIYTDETHPIAIAKGSYLPNMVNSAFFEKNKDAFKAYAKKIFQKQINAGKTFIDIPNIIFDDEILKVIINNKDNDKIRYSFNEITHGKLTEEEEKIIKDNNLEFAAKYRDEYKEISSKYLIDRYTKSDLNYIKRLSLYIPIKEKEMDNLIHVNNNAKIIIDTHYDDKDDEESYIRELSHIFNKIASHNHAYNIEIRIENRELLRRSKLLDNFPQNINLTIVNDLYDYDLETYLNEEKKLERIVGPIRESNLSPLEKYLAAYDITKKFKPYKENKEKPEMARNLRYILDDNNEYIVCVGFASLLKELLNRLDIPCTDLSVGIDTSYDKGYTQEEKIIENAGHARNLVKIDDDKYDIHGYYVVDSTWDNDMEYDYYLNALMTFDRKKEAKRLERISNIDLIMDFHNMEEFKDKIKFMIQRDINSTLHNKEFETYEMSKIKNTKSDYQKKIDSAESKEEKSILKKKMDDAITKIENEAYKNSYDRVYNIIVGILHNTDKEEYEYIFDKYSEKFNSNSLSIDELEKAFNDLLFDYVKYILPLVNNDYPLKNIINAAAVGKKKVEGYTNSELQEWLAETFEVNEKYASKAFPYKYDPNNKTEAFLEDVTVEETKKR